MRKKPGGGLPKTKQRIEFAAFGSLMDVLQYYDSVRNFVAKVGCFIVIRAIMKVIFPQTEIVSPFKVGDKVRVHIATLYKKPPYEVIEGTVYQVRVAFPLLWATKENVEYELAELTFRYGVLPDTTNFPKMKEVENQLYDLPEACLEECG